ncbi:MAG: cytochrome c [Bacteroidetes bacterium]|jgi:mono/diheme cytochrome c family protein|nr:cytochrome c [Bacteroidota bacterium]MBK7588554.1 cytochrome c [Bacteroidota bacterium]MBK8328746.1 cytochrome c [Bacteroidota bacterium]HMT34288.1 cytochrome c [Chitinophagaceae bacterium]HQW45727.1 cytochrome c [Chitinophagaceae bacterium]
MKKSIIYILFVAVTTLIVSCSEYNRKPGRVYAPDMVYSRAVDYYNGTEKIEDAKGSYNKMPVKGTVAREQALPDHIAENDTLLANANTCKFDLTEKDVEEGKRLYMIYCGICHGTALDGNGPLYSSGKFVAMPANLKSGEKYLAMSSGRIYHGIVYGKNAMGSYASQLDTKQRWQVVAYIKKIQSENGGAPFTMVAGMTSSAPKDSVKVEAKAPTATATPNTEPKK